jgi:hypothetical protein
VENKGFWALEAPPKRAKQMNARGLFIGWQDTGVHSNALPAFERSNPWCNLWSHASPHFRTQPADGPSSYLRSNAGALR